MKDRKKPERSIEHRKKIGKANSGQKRNEVFCKNYSKRMMGNKYAKTIPCFILGIKYDNIKEAEEKLKMTRYFIKKELNNPNNQNFLYLEGTNNQNFLYLEGTKNE